MSMVKLIYVSKAKNISLNKAREILESSRENNQKNSLTGILHFNDKYFLQCLEGSRENVNRTYQKILGDDRHSQPVLLSYDVIIERSFPNWSMGYVSSKDIKNDISFKYSNSKEFNPYDISGESADLLLKALSKYTQN